MMYDSRVQGYACLALPGDLLGRPLSAAMWWDGRGGGGAGGGGTGGSGATDAQRRSVGAAAAIASVPPDRASIGAAPSVAPSCGASDRLRIQPRIRLRLSRQREPPASRPMAPERRSRPVNGANGLARLCGNRPGGGGSGSNYHVPGKNAKSADGWNRLRSRVANRPGWWEPGSLGAGSNAAAPCGASNWLACSPALGTTVRALAVACEHALSCAPLGQPSGGVCRGNSDLGCCPAGGGLPRGGGGGASSGLPCGPVVRWHRRRRRSG